MCLCGILVGSYSNLQIVDQVDVRLQIRRYPPRKYYTKTISFNVTLGPSIKVKILLFQFSFDFLLYISSAKSTMAILRLKLKLPTKH